jgi:uncharacterized protein DUF1990
VREELLSQADELNRLAGLRVNYDPAQAPEHGAAGAAGHWHVDSGITVIGREAPGLPEPGGPWETACRLAGQYEFADARTLRGVYRPDGDLLGRNMLLEAWFYGLRFYLGVRVTGILDEERDTGDGPERVWGWSYQTLEGHLEQGRLSYEVIKNLGTGRVMFRVAGYSRPAPSATRSSAGAFCCSAGGRSSGSTATSRPGWPTWWMWPSGAARSRSPRSGRTASCWRRPGCARTRWNASPVPGRTPPAEIAPPGKEAATATQDLLGIYLNDHLAGATTGTGLARRMAASAEPETKRAATLSRLASEITADRAALLRIMATLGTPVRGYKVFAAWAGERAGRLKLNGRLLTRSPLSDLEETEMLRLGVDGKAAGWRTLRALAERDSRLDAGRLDDLLARADRQSSELESLRISTAERLLAGEVG